MFLLIKVFFLLLAFSYFLLLSYFIFGWAREQRFFYNQSTFSTFATIIIPARNEEENIGVVLKDLSEQNYPRHLFEIIVADDCSEDGTTEKACQWQSSLPNLKVLKNDRDFPGKKNVILKGINQSRGELIITTDADCRMGKNWLPSIISFFEEKKPEMIIAPVCFRNENSFFEKIQSLEFLSLSGITGASALSGNPLLCNGANLAYKKTAFFEVNGFSGNEQTPSGDDVLLMLKIKKKFNGGIKFLKSQNAIVFTEGQKTVSQFINQRRRWLSKNRFYKDFFVVSSSWLVFLFTFSILVSSALHIMNKGFGEILLFSFLIKFFIDFLFLFLAASFFNRKALLWLYLPVQIMYILYVPALAFASLAGNFSWKGRNYN